MKKPLAATPFTITLWGPTNVGKSTLFNKLTSTRKAIVANRPGVTVDTHLLDFEKGEVGFVRVIDSGGVGAGLVGHALKDEIEKRAMHALEGANLVLFVVDGTQNVPEVENLALILRRNLPKGCDVLLVVNKADRKDFSENDFYPLGFKTILPVSAEHGKGVEQIWDEVRARIGEFSERNAGARSKETEDASEEATQNIGADDFSIKCDVPRVLILGRPNVGKSTLMNYLTKTNISAVSPVAGTTRDYVSSRSKIDDEFEIILTDTAGLRRPGRRERDVEWVATNKIIDLSRRADVAVLVIDSSEGVTDQDTAIAGFAIDAGLSLVVAFNKWDLVKESNDQEYDQSQIERSKNMKMAFLSWCPIVRISAQTELGVKTLKTKILEVAKARELRVQTAELNSLFEHKIKDTVSVSGGSSVNREKLYYMSQISVNPPEFVLFTNQTANKIHFSFRRFVANTLREEFGFSGTPIKLHFKQR